MTQYHLPLWKLFFERFHAAATNQSTPLPPPSAAVQVSPSFFRRAHCARNRGLALLKSQCSSRILHFISWQLGDVGTHILAR